MYDTEVCQFVVVLLFVLTFFVNITCFTLLAGWPILSREVRFCCSCIAQTISVINVLYVSHIVIIGIRPRAWGGSAASPPHRIRPGLLKKLIIGFQFVHHSMLFGRVKMSSVFGRCLNIFSCKDGSALRPEKLARIRL